MNWRVHARVAAFLFVPALLSVALAWIAVGTPSFLALVAVNAVVTYPVFLTLVVGYEWLAKRTGTTVVLWQHCTFVFVVVSLIQFCVSYFSFRTYGQYQWQDVLIVSGGEFTSEGMRFLFTHALVVGLKYAAAIAVFWVVSRAARTAAVESNR
jgi:hypothetical protein